MGPCVIFDKSFLQALNPDQAIIFDLLYQTNVVPVLFGEILADLAKEEARRRKPEDVTAGLSAKAPSMNVYSNGLHTDLCIGEMLGRTIAMEGLPVIRGGERIKADGREGTIFDLPREIEALQRWADRDFTKGERSRAATLRETVKTLDLDRLARQFTPQSSVNNEQQAREEAIRIVQADGARLSMLRQTLDMLGVSNEYRKIILSRWKRMGRPSLPIFAPYTAYVMTIQVFFGLALGKGIIAKERPSNQMDMAYLFYLPFCSIFVSGDKLHARMAPLFMRTNQRFVSSATLREDLIGLDAHYSAMEIVQIQGLHSVTGSPPKEGRFLVQELWDLAQPGWRTGHNDPIPVTPEVNEAIVRQLAPILSSMKNPELRRPTKEGAKQDITVLTRRVPVRRGKWQILHRDAADT